jgi:hypothetical protein
MPDLNLLSVKIIPAALSMPAAAPFVGAPRYQSHCAALFAEARVHPAGTERACGAVFRQTGRYANRAVTGC